MSSSSVEKPAEINTEENSRLLETTANPEGYGSQKAEQETLISNMVSDGKGKVGPQIFAALAASGGALVAGTVLGWTSLKETDIVENNAYGFPVSVDAFSWVGSLANVGAAITCIPAGFLIQAIGRKYTMISLVLPLLLGWCLLTWAQNIYMLCVARVLLGVGSGGFCVAAPMYTGEIAHKDIRGTLGSFFQFMITIGILLVYGLGAGLNLLWYNLVCLILPIIFFVIFIWAPESQTYLIGKGKKEKAIKSIQWLRGKDYDYNSEISELEAEDAKIKAVQGNVFSALFRRNTCKGLVIGLGLMFFQQLSGINAVIFYSGTIFDDANSGLSKELSAVVIGCVQVLATFISVMIVDKTGRRILLIASGISMAVCTLILGVYFFLQAKDKDSVQSFTWLPVVSLCVFIIMFSIGYGPVPWLMMGEIFAPDIKGVAGSIAGTSNWVLAFIVTKTYAPLKNSIGGGPVFWIFSAITILGVVFTVFLVPETKGKSLAEVQLIINGSSEKSAAKTAA